ncbi:NAD(P)H-hydrate dehydratase [Pseudochelatococcus sp. B33]
MAVSLLTTDRMREADRRTIEAGTPGYTLMQRAGHAVADRAVQLLAKRTEISRTEISRTELSRAETSPFRPGDAGGRIAAVLCGPGNNGGDGFVAARVLAARGFTVRLGLFGSLEALKGDAAEAAADWSGDVLATADVDLGDAHVIVDALLGAGLDRDLPPELQHLVQRINDAPAPVVAVDTPTGIDGDSGAVRGAAVMADVTVTFARAKPGHYLYPGRAHCGVLHVDDIGIASALVEELSAGLVVNRPEALIRTALLPAATAHKYGRGHALVASGGATHTGAARLAARAALRVGAGLVTVASPRDALAENAAHLTAVMLREADTPEAFGELLADARFNAVAVGPAAGVGERTIALARAAAAAERALVLDADVLTSFSGDAPALTAAIAPAREKGVVLTPHDGEFTRLFANVPDIAAGPSKLVRAQRAAALTGAVVVLKGADTVIAAPDGRAAINDNGTPWLATAGSGDVLAGLVAGLLAQGLPAYDAACAAVWLHGAAGQRLGPGLIAEDLPEALPQVLKGLIL